MRRVGSAVALALSLVLGAVIADGWASAPRQPRARVASSRFLGPGLSSVSCRSVRFCEAVGERPATRHAPRTVRALRWNGSSWSEDRIPSPSRTAVGSLVGVSCPSTRFCVAVGATFGARILPVVEVFRSGRWSLRPFEGRSGPSEAELYSVSCTSSTACIAVGSAYIGDTSFAVAARWDGRSSWSQQTIPEPAGVAGSELTSVSCTSPSACTAVGDALRANGNPQTLAERWDGQLWSIQRTPTPFDYAELEGVSCPSAATCVAVGQVWRRDNSNAAVAERWNGTAWIVERLPSLGGDDGGLYDVACASTRTCTAVGWSLSSPGLVAERWNRARWSLQTTADLPEPSEFDGVSCATAHACAAVGTALDGSAITEAWNGHRWSDVTRPHARRDPPA